MTFKSTSILAAALLLTACGTKEKLSDEALIATPQGQVQGVTTEDNGIYNFKGIPYAAAPVGDLRWAAPQPAPVWQDVRTAENFGAMCMQPTDESGGFLTSLIEGHGLGKFKNWLVKKAIAGAQPNAMSEDCLFLNVRTANLSGDEKQPVMLWIHGGAHQFGSADTTLYQANALAAEGVVLVTINYRLGVFGYMAHPALSVSDPNGVSGNYGTLDQIAALKWVRDNISAYGGDPDNVTIFGESAGSWSVNEMMASPLAAGLFHKAIGQSGASTYHLGQMDKDVLGWPGGYGMGEKVAMSVGLTDPSAADLRAVPAETIIANLPPKADEAFHHVRDGYVFPQNVGQAFTSGKINSVPMITGYNADEATLFFPGDSEPTVWLEGFPHGGDRAKVKAYLSDAFPNNADALIDLYALDDDSMAGGMAMMGDEIFGTNVRYVAETNAAAGSPTYMYHFSRIPPSKKQSIGAFHAAEIAFIFGSHEPVLGHSDEDEQLSQMMTRYWANFAKTGNPNGEGLLDWPQYGGDNWMHFSGNTGQPIAQLERDVRGAKLDALEEGLRVKLDALETALSPQSSPGIVASGPE